MQPVEMCRVLLAAGVVLATGGGEVQGVVTEDQKLESSDLAAGDIYAAAVAVDENVAIVAAEYDDDNGTDSGSAHVYRHTDGRWSEKQKLKASDGSAGDNFGRSVSVNGDLAVVGAHWDDDDGSRSGSAYVFRRAGSEWLQEQKLRASDGATEDRFGVSVSVSGDVVGVAAWLEDQAGRNAGAAYMYRYKGGGWVEEQKLIASDAAAGDNFGRYISVSENVAVIGAWKENERGVDAGAAYVFRYNGSQWVEEQKLVASDAAPGDLFGWATYVAGNVAVVGAYGDDDAGSESGSAYVFRYDGSRWVEEQKLVASDGAGSERFGYSVALRPGLILVGAPVDLKVVSGPGAAYVYRYDGRRWSEKRKLVPSDGAPQDAFGFHVALSGDVALSGAWRNDDAGRDSGSAYVYTVSDAAIDEVEERFEGGGEN